jgi:hypothetical protein
MRAHTLLQARIARLRSTWLGPGMRPIPCNVAVTGPPGVGKTFLTQLLGCAIMAGCGFEPDASCIYKKNADNPWCDDYDWQRHKVWAIDEINAAPGARENAENMAELIKLLGEQEHTLRVVDPERINTLSAQQYGNVCISNDEEMGSCALTSQAAFFRRFMCVLRVEVAEEYRTRVAGPQGEIVASTIDVAKLNEVKCDAQVWDIKVYKSVTQGVSQHQWVHVASVGSAAEVAKLVFDMVVAAKARQAEVGDNLNAVVLEAVARARGVCEQTSAPEVAVPTMLGVTGHAWDAREVMGRLVNATGVPDAVQGDAITARRVGAWYLVASMAFGPAFWVAVVLLSISALKGAEQAVTRAVERAPDSEWARETVILAASASRTGYLALGWALPLWFNAAVFSRVVALAQAQGQVLLARAQRELLSRTPMTVVKVGAGAATLAALWYATRREVRTTAKEDKEEFLRFIRANPVRWSDELRRAVHATGPQVQEWREDAMQQQAMAVLPARLSPTAPLGEGLRALEGLVERNTYRVKVTDESGPRGTAVVTMVQGRMGVMNRHCFRDERPAQLDLLARDAQEEGPLRKSHTVEVGLTRHDVPSQDATFVRINMMPHGDLVRRLPPEFPPGALPVGTRVRLYVVEDERFLWVDSQVTRSASATTVRLEGSVHMTLSVRVRYAPKVGASGGWCLAHLETGWAPVGLVAGVSNPLIGEGQGVVQLLPRAWVGPAAEALGGAITTTCCRFPTIEPEAPSYKSWACRVPVTLRDYRALGATKERGVIKHRYQPNQLAELLPGLKHLAMSAGADKFAVPLFRAMVGVGEEGPVWLDPYANVVAPVKGGATMPASLLRAVADEYLSRLSWSRVPRCPLTAKEAVFGVPGEVPPVDLSRSAGVKLGGLKLKHVDPVRKELGPVLQA